MLYNLLQFQLKLVLKCQINNKSALIQVIAWCCQPTHTCLPEKWWPRITMPHTINRPQWAEFMGICWRGWVECLCCYLLTYTCIWLKCYSSNIWVRSRRCTCLVTCFCYQMITKPGHKTDVLLWPDPSVIQKFVKTSILNLNLYIYMYKWGFVPLDEACIDISSETWMGDKYCQFWYGLLWSNFQGQPSSFITVKNIKA